MVSSDATDLAKNYSNYYASEPACMQRVACICREQSVDRRRSDDHHTRIPSRAHREQSFVVVESRV